MGLATTIVPDWSVVPPVKVFAPDSVKVPLPTLMSDPPTPPPNPPS
jgi:hypothetical protein